MRLQITVLRNQLAPVRNIFNTAAQEHSESRLVLISDLLKAVDAVIKLEVDTWGFEDYAVETKCNVHQTEPYECFHWQHIEDVFKEDDEVLIRPLSSTEVRERKHNGRFQRTDGGIHTIDGAPWGRSIRANTRPQIHIPPRRENDAPKQLRDVPQATLENAEPQLQIEDHPRRTTVRFLDNEEDDDDDFEGDQDFESEVEDSESEDVEDDVEDEQEDEIVETLSNSRQILIEAEFDDEDSDEEHIDQDNDLQYEVTELRALIEETESKPLSKKRKRSDRLEENEQKRQHTEEDLVEDRPDQSLSSRKQSAVDGTIVLANSVSMNGTSADGNANATSSEDSSSDYKSSSEHEDETDDSPHARQRNVVRVTYDTSSSGSDTSNDTSDSDASAYSSDESSDSDESNSGSDSGQLSESEKPGIKTVLPHSLGKTDTTAVNSRSEDTNCNLEQQVPPNQNAQSSDNDQLTKRLVAPGQGQMKTKRNNERKKLNKLMNRLKEEGKLDKDADFTALRTYLDQHKEVATTPPSTAKASTMQDELDARREEMLQRLNAPDPLDTVTEADVEMATLAPAQPQDEGQVDHTETIAETTESTTQKTQSAPETALQHTEVVSTAQDQRHALEEEGTRQPEPEERSPKRTKLDVASSRRMLFSALGVRNPKTPAAEQALREKLAKPSRQVKSKEVESSDQSTTETLLPSQDRWKSKLIIKAVECVAKDRGQIEVPPFPFKHPHQVRKEKERAHEYQEEEDFSHYDLAQQQGDENNTQEADLDYDDNPSQAWTTSRTITTGTDHAHEELPIPSDFNVLFDLVETDLVEGAVIAYKELHLGQDFQPQESDYRVAKILARNNRMLSLKLAPEHRRKTIEEYDEETGERIRSKFDVPMDDGDDEGDDGVREVYFDLMRSAKFVCPSETAEIVIAPSQPGGPNGPTGQEQNGQIPSTRGGFIDDSTSRVAETEPEVSSSRKDEINGLIRDAGFESALDEQLLQPLQEPTVVENEPFASSQPEPEHHEEVVQDDEWRSTPVVASPPVPAVAESTGFRESSVPSESMVESVRYPHLSQLEVDIPAMKVQSSSHQDAQRLTPTPAGDTSGISYSELPSEAAMDDSNVKHNSLPSVVAETQSQNPRSAPETQPTPNEAGRSSPFNGFDGVADAGDDTKLSDDESLDSSGLPSVHSIFSSSQTHGSSGSRSIATKKSPEPSRRSPRVNKVGSSRDSDNESPPPRFKSSQSQRLSRLSQIPEDTIVVDLTQSSPVNSPQKASRSKAASTRSALSSQHASVFKRSFEGLGEKSLLKHKKRRS